MVSNCPRCQIVLGVKLSSLPSWCQIVLLAIMVSNCPRCQIVLGVKLSSVSNGPRIVKTGVSVQRQVRAAAKSVAKEGVPCKSKDRHIVRNLVKQGSAKDVLRMPLQERGNSKWLSFANLITFVSHVKVVVPQQFMETELKAQCEPFVVHSFSMHCPQRIDKRDDVCARCTRILSCS